MSCMFNLSEPLVIPRKKISTFVEAHRVIRISEQGITTPKGKLLLWNKILYCQYVVVHGRYTHVDLFLRTNHNYKERIHLNDYFCNHRELRAAIAFYSRGKVELESKEEF